MEISFVIEIQRKKKLKRIENVKCLFVYNWVAQKV